MIDFEGKFTYTHVMAETPQFLLDLFEQEIHKIRKAVLRKVADTYDIDYEELETTILMEKLSIVPNEEVRVHISRPRSANILPKDRCQSRIWNRGNGGQCKRKCTQAEGEDGRLCRQHNHEWMTHQKLRHGWIHDTPPAEVFQNKGKKALHTS